MKIKENEWHNLGHLGRFRHEPFLVSLSIHLISNLFRVVICNFRKRQPSPSFAASAASPTDNCSGKSQTLHFKFESNFLSSKFNLWHDSLLRKSIQSAVATFDCETTFSNLRSTIDQLLLCNWNFFIDILSFYSRGTILLQKQSEIFRKFIGDENLHVVWCK